MPHAPDLSGRALDDRYELHAILGEGAFGRVYEGIDRRLARSVAVKVIKPWWADDPEWVAIFERETRLLARLSDPGIVRIYDVGNAPEGLYYVSELVHGESLAARLRRGPLPAWEACGVATQLCRALAGAHAQRIVHRDVKPANILLSTEGQVKVGDFGVARLAEGSTDGRGSHPASIVGTPRYMAPEQGRGHATTPATDVYSAGVVLYEMLSGAPPFSASSAVELALLHLQEPPPPLPPRLPAPLVEIVERALAKDPAHRYADGAAMAEALMQARPRARATARRPLVAAAAGGVGSTSTLDPPPPPRTPVHSPLPPPPRGPTTAPGAPPRCHRRATSIPAGRRRAAAAATGVRHRPARRAMVAAALVIVATPPTPTSAALMHESSGPRRRRRPPRPREAHLRPPPLARAGAHRHRRDPAYAGRRVASGTAVHAHHQHRARAGPGARRGPRDGRRRRAVPAQRGPADHRSRRPRAGHHAGGGGGGRPPPARTRRPARLHVVTLSVAEVPRSGAR